MSSNIASSADTARTPATIELSGIDYSIEGNEILRGISISANERRIGIVGRNGSGKSTLARILAGLVKPSAGTVRIAGVDTVRDRKKAIRTVGILFQNPDHQIIFPTVAEELGFGLIQLGRTKAEAGEEVQGALKEFGKLHWSDVPVHGLSQGQRHLVCLMAVLLMRPKVIILDEPLSGMDIPTTRQLMRTLHDVDATLIHISHDPAVIASYDRVIWLEKGQIEMDGATEHTLAAFVDRMEQIGAGDDLSHISG